MHWYKRDPDAAIAGMAELTFEERGAYNGVLDLLYSRDGDVPDDDAVVARILGAQPRQWARLKKQLIARGKIWVEDGKITAKRVAKTISEAKELATKQRTKANQRWNKDKKDSENKDRDDAVGNASTTTSTTTSIEGKKDSGAVAPTAGKPKRERKYATGLSAGFEPNWEAATRAGLSRREADREFLKFKNHAEQTARTCVSWQAAWSNWCIKAAEYLKKPPPSHPSQTLSTITPKSPSWNAWKSHYRDTGQNFKAAHMDKCADEGRPVTVPTEWPPGHEKNAA